MESMYKCRQDKEDWHLKLLEQHQKAMADFDRRLLLATDDQAKRVSLPPPPSPSSFFPLLVFLAFRGYLTLKLPIVSP
jgi:hypothetical protein